jgi:hypothetical protein
MNWTRMKMRTLTTTCLRDDVSARGPFLGAFGSDPSARHLGTVWMPMEQIGETVAGFDQDEFTPVIGPELTETPLQETAQFIGQSVQFLGSTQYAHGDLLSVDTKKAPRTTKVGGAVLAYLLGCYDGGCSVLSCAVRKAYLA